MALQYAIHERLRPQCSSAETSGEPAGVAVMIEGGEVKVFNPERKSTTCGLKFEPDVCPTSAHGGSKDVGIDNGSVSITTMGQNAALDRAVDQQHARVAWMKRPWNFVSELAVQVVAIATHICKVQFENRVRIGPIQRDYLCTGGDSSLIAQAIEHRAKARFELRQWEDMFANRLAGRETQPLPLSHFTAVKLHTLYAVECLCARGASSSGQFVDHRDGDPVPPARFDHMYCHAGSHHWSQPRLARQRCSRHDHLMPMVDRDHCQRYVPNFGKQHPKSAFVLRRNCPQQIAGSRNAELDHRFRIVVRFGGKTSEGVYPNCRLSPPYFQHDPRLTEVANYAP